MSNIEEYLIYLLEGCGFNGLEKDEVFIAHLRTALVPPLMFETPQLKWEGILIEMLQIHFLICEPFEDMFDIVSDLPIPDKYLYNMAITRLRLLVDYCKHRKENNEI